MKENKLISTSNEFAANIINLDEKLRHRGKALAIINQLLRSGTSIGANIYEANYAASRADFVNKLQIALKECYETEYWLEILHKVGSLPEVSYRAVSNKCGTIRRKLIASITTAKSNKTKPVNK